MNKRLSCRIALVLILALALSLCPAASAEEDGAIHIGTAQELLQLAQDCSLDTWSDGKRIVLDCDLSLSGVAFASIPIFNGSFDGGGHTIYDLDLRSAQSPCGFFLETGKDADIHDLKLSGTVSTHGDDSMVGGLVGLNRGRLSACSFSGEVRALKQVGGLVGFNDGTGTISDCEFSGSVQGLSQTGGLVGENAGVVEQSRSSGFVNTESVDPKLHIESIDTSSVLNLIHSLRTDSAGITTDTGGIAGSSSGFVERCINVGTVGYLHLGYNVGGIVGRSDGFVSGCLNTGEVYGRKDVGGIVGQAEPMLEISQAENLLAALSYRLACLNRSVNEAVEDARSARGDLSARISNVASYLAPVGEAVAAIELTDPESALYLNQVISECVYNITNEVAAISVEVEGNAGILDDDLRDIIGNAEALSGTAVQTLGSAASSVGSTDGVVVDDSEGLSEEQVTFGKVEYSENDGSIYGDSNVGGIAGNLSIESELDPESELTGSGSSLARSQVSLRTIVTGCTNRGAVTAKRECAGGIAGKMEIGYASRCAAYGPVAIEDGSYAGGICGLLYGSVKSSCAKCSLSGKRYIGGICGNGYTSDGKEEKSSSVSDCYTLVELLNAPQFAGAVSGGGDGVYENNFFVPAGYAGLDRLSIHGKAEPLTFEEFAAVETLPEDCKTFTLRFVVDGRTVKELPFAYGDSFDHSVFPRVERRDGSYAVWDRYDLSDLRFDTTVTAEYRLDESVLRSELEREDGRAAVYVDGQFQAGDALLLTPIPVEAEDIRLFTTGWQETVRAQLRSIFREHEPDYSIPVSVAERLRVSFPDDGLDSHSLRYLAPDGQTVNYRLYLNGEEGWIRIHPRTFGSYFLFEVPGSEAEIALVTTIQSWWIVAYLAAALVILLLLIVAIVKLRRFLRARPKKQRPPLAERPVRRWLRAHRKPVLITLPILLLAAAGTAVLLRFGSVGAALSTYRVLKGFSREESDVLTEISIRTDERDVQMSTTVHRVLQDGHMIRCVEQYGIPLYISGGMVCLENGRVFRLAEGSLRQTAVLDLALELFLHEQVEQHEEDGATVYEAVLDSEMADSILQYFLSAGSEELLRADSMTAALRARDGKLLSLSFRGGGAAAGGKAFTFDVELTPQAMTERPVIPQAVREAIANGGGENTQLLSEDLLRLLAAWIKYESAESVSAALTVDADCGSLKLSSDYRYFRKLEEGTEIHSIQSALYQLYFTDSAACTAAGADLSEAQQRVRAAARLIPIAKELCLKGNFACAGAEPRYLYTVTLSADDAADIVSHLLPELDRLKLSYSACALRITLDGGALDSLELDCGGSLRVVSRDVDTSVRVSARFDSDSAGIIPSRVLKALVER